MDGNLKAFLTNTRLNTSVLENRLTHPITKVVYPPRSVFDQLKNHSKNFLSKGLEPRFISLVGLRGVGKTTLLWQTAHFIQTNHQTETYFFNVNTLKILGVSLHHALEVFQAEIIKKRFNEISTPIVLLFDEVHDDENWSRTLKVLYDEARSAFILCTGSSALLFNTTADLSRRMHILKVFPFSFSELLVAKNAFDPNLSIPIPHQNLGIGLREALFFSENEVVAINKLKELGDPIKLLLHQNSVQVNQLVEQYIAFLNFPNLLFFNDEMVITNAILDLFKRIVQEDIPILMPSLSDFSKIERLILRLAGSDEINPDKLAGIIGVKKSELLDFIEILAKAELLNVLIPYGGLDTKIVKNKKAFFMSPSLRRAMLTTLYGQNLPVHFQSKLLEDLVVMILKRVLPDGVLSYTTGGTLSNPDFVIETRDLPILLEIGTQKVSLKQLKNSPIHFRYALLVSNGISEPILNSNCISLPLNWFLML